MAALSIFEVGPRDGLQSESKVLSVEERVQLISALMDSGLQDIEIGSFVRADKIPQLKDTDRVVANSQALRKAKGLSSKKLRFWTFVPNQRGFDDAVKSQVDGVSFFIAVSPTFCVKNVNRTQEEILAELKLLLIQAKKNKVLSRVYISTISYCPYEGDIAPAKAIKLATAIYKLGANEVVLSDTTGSSDPFALERILKVLVKKIPRSKLALHLHDTRGLALTNIFSALKFGLTRFDSSLGGMGGCPYAPGASGNLSTEDLANMLMKSKKLKGVNMLKLCEAGRLAQNLLEKKLPSKFLQAYLASEKLS